MYSYSTVFPESPIHRNLPFATPALWFGKELSKPQLADSSKTNQSYSPGFFRFELRKWGKVSYRVVGHDILWYEKLNPFGS